MDSHLLQSIVDADYALPAGHSAAGLLPELMAALGAPDPHLRDELAYMILATWIARGLYSPAELRAIAEETSANLSHGLGEVETDSVLLRSFSALILGEVIDADNAAPFLQAEEVHRWLAVALAYAPAERDVRGYVPGRGWAHAAAHMADMLGAFARNRHVDAAGLERILSAIRARVNAPLGYVFHHREDERLAYAVMLALQRGLVALPRLQAWVDQLAAAHSRPIYRQTCTEEGPLSAHHNAQQLLRSLYFQLLLGARPPAECPPQLREALLARILAGLRTMDSGFYAPQA